MKRLLLLFLALVISSRVQATALGDLEVIPVPGWKSADTVASNQAEPSFPMLKFVPEDGRNAAIFISALPARVGELEINDLESLKEVNLAFARPYLPSPDARPAVTKLKIAGGLGVSITNEDPALVGKPVPPGEYRMATTATLLIGDQLVTCTIFHDERGSDAFQEAMEILLSVAPRQVNSVI
jgi:hypothetical protein